MPQTYKKSQRKKQSNHVAAESSSDPKGDHLRVITELLEDTFELALEDHATGDAETFTAFVTSLVPEEYLHQIVKLTSSSEDEEESSEVLREYLENVWEERFAVHDEEQNTESFSSPRAAATTCDICERKVRTTRHHLYPRDVHRRIMKRGLATAEQVRITIPVCRLCHNTIHRFFTNDELATTYNSVDALLSDERFFKFAQWNSLQHDKRNGRCR